MTEAKLLFLGTGGSIGVPMIGCSCPVCKSPNAYNKRLRASALIEAGGKKILIDAGPDFRAQALRAKITNLDGIVLTHSHFDHIAGIDDLRPLCFFRPDPIPCLLSQDTLDELNVRYHYLMERQEGVIYTQLGHQTIEDDFGEAYFCGFKWKYVSYYQMGMKVNGYIIGNLAYISDIREYSEEVTKSLHGIQTLILGALRYEKSKGHFTIDEAIEFARKVKAENTYLTHIGHELDHEEANKLLPPDIRLAYDGLEISFQIGDRPPA